MVVLLKYATKEVDNDRIKASDYKAIILPAEGQESVSADVNDLLQVASFKTFRIITAEKVMVGTTVGLVTAQLRFV